VSNTKVIGGGFNPKITDDARLAAERLAVGKVSGSSTGGTDYLVISASYVKMGSASAEFSDEMPALAGSDVFFYVSGSVNDRQSSRRGVSLFDGDVVVSGTLYAESQVIEVNTTTTGSLSVSGTFFVSQSAEIRQGLTVNSLGAGSTEDDFQVKTANRDHALFANSTNDQIFILSGGSGTSIDESDYPDLAFFVSGTIGSKDSSTKGVSVFGGDTVVSGTLYTDTVKSISDSDNYIDIGSSANHIKFYAGGSEKVNISSTDGLEVADFVAHLGDGDTYITFGDDNVGILAGGQMGLSLNEGANSIVHLGGWTAAAHKYDQVLILSGGAAASPKESGFSDLAFFVSGTIGSKDSSTKGVALFGGDVVVSGTLYPEDIAVTDDLTVSGDLLTAEYIKHIGDTDTYIRFQDDDINIQAGGVDFIKITEDGSQDLIEFNAGDADVDFIVNQGWGEILRIDGTGAVFNDPGHANVDFRVETDNRSHAIFVNAGTDQVLVLSGGAASSIDESDYPDLAFFVSGTIGSKDSSTKGVSVFGGDTVVSGTLYTNEIRSNKDGDSDTYVKIGDDAANGHFQFFSNNNELVNISESDGLETERWLAHLGDGDTFLYFEDDKIQLQAGGKSGLTIQESSTDVILLGGSGTAAHKYDQVLIMSGGNPGSPTEGNYSDLAFFVSGTIGSKDTSTKGVAVFGGDMVTSGAFYASSSVGTISADSVGRIKIVSAGDDGTNNPMVLIQADKVAGSAADTGIQLHTPNGMLTQNAEGVDFNVGVRGVDYDIQGTVSTNPTFFVRVQDSEVSNSIELQSDDGGITIEADGQVTISSDGYSTTGGGSGGNPKSIYLEAVKAGELGGGITIEADQNMGTIVTASFVYLGDRVGKSSSNAGPNVGIASNDVFFHVSGTAGSKLAGSSKNTAVIEGDLVVTGTTYLSMIGTERVSDYNGSDVNLYVSGTIGSKDSSTRGTAVFGGDLVLSGGLEVGVSGSGQDVKLYNTQTDAGGEGAVFHWDADANERGKLTLGEDKAGVDFQVYGETTNNYVLWDQSANALSLYTPQGEIRTKGNVIFDYSSQGWDFTVNSNNKAAIFVDGDQDQVLILSGGAASSTNEATGADIALYVSGTIGGQGQGTRGAALFGGDVVVSGTVYLGSPLGDKVGTNVHTFISGVNGVGLQGDGVGLGGNGAILLGGDTVVSGALVVGPSEDDGSSHWQVDFGSPENVASGIKFVVSGAIGHQGTGESDGQGEASSVFMGDVVVSGSLIVGEGLYEQGGTISGSIHHTSGGLPYLVAGSNVTITSASNGQVTITSSGGGGSSEWTDGGSFLYPSDSSGVETVIIGATAVANADIVLGSDGAATFNEQAADVDFRVESVNNTHMLFVDAGNDRLGIGSTGASPATTVHVKDSSPTVRIQRSNNANNSSIEFAGSAGAIGAMMHLSSSNDLVFKTHNGSSTEEILRLGSYWGSSNRQVILLSGSAVAASSMQPKQSTDINFFVSGTVGSKDSAVKGTTVFGGDTVVSGTLTADRSDDGAHPAIKIDKNYTGTTDVGSLASGGTDATGLTVDYDVTGIVASGQTAYHDAIAVHYNQDAPTHVGTVNATGADIRMTGGTSGVQALKGLAINLTGADTNIGIDVTSPNDSTHFIARSPDNLLDHFKISVGESGTTTLTTSDQGASAANFTVTADGDINLDAAGKITIEAEAGDEVVFNEASADVDFRVETNGKTHAIFANGGTDQVLILSGGAAASADEASKSDVNFYVSGTIGSKDTSTRGTAVFGGDLFISGSTYVENHILPAADVTYNLGSIDKRFANIYTGDLHLRNERGNWTIVEERDYLCVINNITGRKYEMLLRPIDE
jgi:hypothetical protein